MASLLSVGSPVLYNADRSHTAEQRSDSEFAQKCQRACVHVKSRRKLSAQVILQMADAKSGRKPRIFHDIYHFIYIETTVRHESSQIRLHMGLMTAHTHFSHRYCLNFGWERPMWWKTRMCYCARCRALDAYAHDGATSMRKPIGWSKRYGQQKASWTEKAFRYFR